MISRPVDCPAGDCDCRDPEAVDTCPYRILARATAAALSVTPEAFANALAGVSYTKQPDPWENAPSQVAVPGERTTGKSALLGAPYTGRFAGIEPDDLYSGLPF